MGGLGDRDQCQRRTGTRLGRRPPGRRRMDGGVLDEVYRSSGCARRTGPAG